jgi:hypothetical protein
MRAVVSKFNIQYLLFDIDNFHHFLIRLMPLVSKIMGQKLTEVFNRYRIHIGVIEVLAGHAPDKVIVAGSAACVDAPGR